MCTKIQKVVTFYFLFFDEYKKKKRKSYYYLLKAVRIIFISNLKTIVSYVLMRGIINNIIVFIKKF